jgi:hypothetical protein
MKTAAHRQHQRRQSAWREIGYGASRKKQMTASAAWRRIGEISVWRGSMAASAAGKQHGGGGEHGSGGGVEWHQRRHQWPWQQSGGVKSSARKSKIGGGGIRHRQKLMAAWRWREQMAVARHHGGISDNGVAASASWRSAKQIWLKR